jgi:NitT/TauT family transport system substrate-binding protein
LPSCGDAAEAARIRTMSRIARLALLTAALAGTGGCARREAGSERVIVGVSVLRISQPVFVAEANGLFRAHGLDVELRRYETAQPLMDDVVRAQIDAGGFVAYPIVFLAAERAPRAPRLATALIEDAGHRLSYALTRASSSLRFPDDVAGRRIGILPTAAYRAWLQAILRTAIGVPRDVAVVPLAPALEGGALESGAVDFLFTNDPVATSLLTRGLARVADGTPPCPYYLGDPFSFGTFALSAPLAEDRPDVAGRLVAAIDDAIAIIEREPAAGPRAMSAYLRPEERPIVERAPRPLYLDSRTAGAALLAREIEQELELGVIRDKPNVSAWLGHPSR